ncbi:hypothetical protein HOH11_00355 [Candidatus Woesearchaeota archaeon]|jgi:hypothetical protein|nr:hypothetical protein [Candidatus Woesearchaeota archaeon]MBT6023044.1 hypothetical protein [Candidatus Woesearchaeota archaeon]
MKKGASMLFAIIFGLIMTVVLVMVGATLLSTTLSLEDDQDMAVYSLRAIATSVNQATTADSCSSAEIKMTRSYQIKAEGNLLILYNRELEKDDDGKVIKDDDGKVISKETKSIDSITLNMDPDGEIICQSESRTCANVQNLTRFKEEKEAGDGYSEIHGLTINPSFNREIDETFCVCNIGDRISLVYTPVPSIPFIPIIVSEKDNFVVYSKKWFDFGCDDPVSQFQVQ